MTARYVITCDQCHRDVAAASFPYPLTITDAGGAEGHVCSLRCLETFASRTSA